VLGAQNVKQIRDLFAKAANKMRTTPDPPYESPRLFRQCSKARAVAGGVDLQVVVADEAEPVPTVRGG
jgi:hypothetical protein